MPVTEVTPLNYSIYQNGIEVASGSLNDSYDFYYSIDGLSIGIYNFTSIVTDYLNNTVEDSAFLTVRDTINPYITGPPDVTYEEGETGNIISWTATDLDPGVYTISLNSSEFDVGTWVSGTPIDIDLDSLAIGIYNFTIVVEDQSENVAIDMVIVEVTGEIGISSDIIIIIIAGIAFGSILFLGLFIRYKMTKKNKKKKEKKRKDKS